MRVLVLQNLYPPLGHGGYAEACAAAVRGLQARGHEVLVLTSTYGLTTGVHDEDRSILRTLEPNPWFIFQSRGSLVQREWHNQRVLKKAIGLFRPDLVFVWAMDGLSASLVTGCFDSGLPVVFNIQSWWLRDIHYDPWMVFWNHIPVSNWRRLAKNLLIASGLRSVAGRVVASVRAHKRSMEYCMFPSQYRKQEYREAGIAVDRAIVIYNGVDTKRFFSSDRSEHNDGRLRLLYAGLWDEAKGVMNAIEAVLLLSDDLRRQVHLTLIGSAPNQEAEQVLRQFVEDNFLSNFVNFAGRAVHDQMPDVYRGHDVLIFPSIVAEGLPLTLLEGMASGLAIISTATGGSQEVLVHAGNALVVPASDSQAIANGIQLLHQDRDLLARLGRGGVATVRERFENEVIQDRIEAYLLSIYNGRQKPDREMAGIKVQYGPCANTILLNSRHRWCKKS